MAWLSRFTDGLSKTRERLTTGVRELFTHRKLTPETLDGLEELLLSADVGLSTTEQILTPLRDKKLHQDMTFEEVQDLLINNITQLLEGRAQPLPLPKGQSKPLVILFAGVNGSGKTTSIAKIAHHYQELGYSVGLVAGDTFRAAGIEQLEVWAKRLGVSFFAREAHSDPAALCFEAIKEASQKGLDVLLLDTAGRLQNNPNLMAELEKIYRVLHKLDPHFPHLTLLVLDATVGQNAFSQAEGFSKALPINGLILSKLDGTAKGGVVLSLSEKYFLFAIGCGEGLEDLRPFDGAAFARALFQSE